MANYKNIFKTAALGMALAATSQVHASNINVGGVVWNPDAGSDFSSQASMVEKSIANVGDILSGIGIVDKINLSGTFCPGCELTYEFGGYQVTNNTPGNLVFSGGWINLYVDNTPNFDFYNKATAVDGVLWLSLAGVTDLNPNTLSGIGTLFGSVTGGLLGSGNERGGGSGFLDVTGGIAASNFDTNKKTTLLGYKSDINFTSTFQPLGDITPDGFNLLASANLKGDTVPEPASLALLGAGLLGMGASAARRRKAV